jgi:hypothetical protein
MTGNCNIHAERKILVMNETKRYEIWQIKNFSNLPQFVIESEKKNYGIDHLHQASRKFNHFIFLLINLHQSNEMFLSLTIIRCNKIVRLKK